MGGLECLLWKFFTTCESDWGSCVSEYKCVLKHI